VFGNLALLKRLYDWWTRFVSILKGEVAPPELKASEVDAATIQLFLVSKGYPLWITGKLDTQTREALKKFQADKGLVADGLFGPKTWEALKV
jgi:peptidoglycan hydrolase-like protein with peptidoglycan-binding domain